MAGYKKILILGGYGNFGSRICKVLAQPHNALIYVAGRNLERAQQFCEKNGDLDQLRPICLDQDSDEFPISLKQLQPDLVIHTSGPYQGQDYRVAEVCIEAGSNYIDLADGRGFVCNIDSLNQQAAAKGLFVISGVSTVPALSSVIVDAYRDEFDVLKSIEYAILPGNKVAIGDATYKGILATAGRPFKNWINGVWSEVFGWMDTRRRDFGRPLGRRWLANVNIPDLSLFPPRYPGVDTVRFQAGLELGSLHNTLVLMSWLVKQGVVKDWSSYSDAIIRLKKHFMHFGSDLGGMHVLMSGQDQHGVSLKIQWQLIAPNGVGPYIPTIPAIIIANQFLSGKCLPVGAMPALGLFELNEALELAGKWGIHSQVETIYE